MLPENQVVFPGSTVYGPVEMGVQLKLVGGRVMMGGGAAVEQ